jgi:hypothetical protein
MTRLSCLGAVGILALLTANLNAVENAATAGLKREIAALKAQEKVAVKMIQAQYDSMINRDKVAESVMEQQRRALHIQEKELLAVATTEEQKIAIRAQYDEMRALLGNDIKLDAKQITRLREMRTAHVRQIEAAYRAKIKFLENELHAIEHMPKPKK